MTQQVLADHCGVSRAAVAQWELAVTRPSLEHLGRAADAMGVWVSWLTGEGEFPARKRRPSLIGPAAEPFR
jgi:transcriptional regulator with XRE-family HTH domain